MRQRRNNLSDAGTLLRRQALLAVNALIVERALIKLFEESRALPGYETIRYGVLEPDEEGIALSLCDCESDPAEELLRMELVLWGRTSRPDELRSEFRSLPRRLPAVGCTVPFEHGSAVVFRQIKMPHGMLFEPERLCGIPVLNAMLFIEVELDVMSSSFHIDDAPELAVLATDPGPEPSPGEAADSAAQYLQWKFKQPVEVRFDSVHPLRRRGRSQQRVCARASEMSPEVLLDHVPILNPAYRTEGPAPIAILPDGVKNGESRLLLVY